MNNIEELKAAATVMRLSSTMRITDEIITFRRLFTPDCALALIAQLEAAQKERDDLLNQEFQQRLANAEHQLYMKDLAIHNIKASRKAQFRKRLAAEAALSAANEKLKGEPVPVVANNGVTAENLRVIKMLLDVCGTAFELADDSCQQDVDGELCHVVPDSAFSRLSDALDEIENTLPDEYEYLPNIVLQWAAIPRHALQELFTSPQKPVVLISSTVMSRAYVVRTIKAAGFTVEGE
ncbi:TPA: hypothetical protein ACPZQD_004117 [Yersinia enterocolitica]